MPMMELNVPYSRIKLKSSGKFTALHTLVENAAVILKCDYVLLVFIYRMCTICHLEVGRKEEAL